MIVANLLTSGGDGTTKTTYTTGTFTPSPNKLVLITVANSRGGVITDIASISGCGLTFEKVSTITTGDIRQRHSLWKAVSSSTSTGSLSITMVSADSTNCQWIVTEFDGVDVSGTNGANAIVQVGSTILDSPAPSGTVTVTLNQFAKNTNAAFGAFRIQLTTTTLTAGSGYTQIAEVKNTNHIQQQYVQSADTTVDWTYANSSGRILCLACELKAVDEGGSFLYNLI